MSSLATLSPPVNPFTPTVACLTDAALYEHAGIVHLQLVRGKGKGTKSKWYRVEPTESDFGVAFRLEAAMGDKLAEGGCYDVLLDGHNTTCSCPGFCFTGGCSHVSALLKFHAKGVSNQRRGSVAVNRNTPFGGNDR